MLRRLEKAEQKWGGSNKLIDQWLSHRRALLVSYCKISGIPPYEKPERSLPSLNDIKNFCGLLLDYVSEGHFEVYDQVVSVCETHGEKSKNLAQSLLPRISKTTDVALEFNDKYSENSNEDILLELDANLSVLMQALETRFQLEDQLLEVLHAHHTSQPAENL